MLLLETNYKLIKIMLKLLVTVGELIVKVM